MKTSRIARVTGMIAGAFMSAALFAGAFGMTAYADSKGTVTVNDVKVRSDASTDASTLTKVSSGTEVTVTDEKSDASGNVWYHVTLSDGTVGYVRSDLMTVTASTDGDQSAETTDAAADADAEAPSGGNVVNGIDVSAITLPEGVDAQDYQSATINVDTGKVRSDASTSDDIVAQLARDTDLVVAGSKLGTGDSKTWYYVAFLDGGTQKTGYVRSDLVNMGEVIVVSNTQEPADNIAEESSAEEASAEPEVNNDYELVYTDDGTGNNVWYLYNHIDNTREKLQELLDYADAQANKMADANARMQKFKIMCIVLGVLLGICVIALIIMIVRLVSGGYEYEEDDEEEEEEEYESRHDRKRRVARHYEEDDEDDDDDDDDDGDEKPAPASARKSAPRNREAAPAREQPGKSKPKNFMLDDDDFEFDFLNMDDK